MEQANVINDLTNAIIEDLTGPHFNPEEHEAYAYVMDSITFSENVGRTESTLMKLLEKVDWDKVNDAVRYV